MIINERENGIPYAEFGKDKVANSNVDHPSHYGGEDNPYEAIKVIDHYDLGFTLGNTIKYVLRAGKKDGNSALQDLKKAQWYLQHEIERLEGYNYH